MPFCNQSRNMAAHSSCAQLFCAAESCFVIRLRCVLLMKCQLSIWNCLVHKISCCLAVDALSCSILALRTCAEGRELDIPRLPQQPPHLPFSSQVAVPPLWGQWASAKINPRSPASWMDGDNCHLPKLILGGQTAGRSGCESSWMI